MTLSPRIVRLGGIAVWLLGLGLLLVLVVAEGWEEVLLATAAAGWGLLWVSLIQALPMLADSVAWRHLVRVDAPPPVRVLFWIRWISEAVNNLLPVATVGGEFLRAWIARRAARLPGLLAWQFSAMHRLWTQASSRGATGGLGAQMQIEP